MQISNLINSIQEPQTLMMARLARELKEKGVDLISLSLGEPDFNTPAHIIEAAKEAMDEGYTKYPPVAGFLELRKAIVTKFKRDNQLDFTPDQILVGTGAKQVLANTVMSLINEGDEVIIPTPYWVTYSDQVKLAKGKCVFVPGTLENDFKITGEQLEAAITPKTRLMMFSSPCNPTGAVYSKQELKELADVLVRHPKVMVISDEIYEYINYVGAHESIAQFEGLKNQVVIINGFSKGFAMTGWRLGYMAGPVPLIQAAAKFQGQITSGANAIAQRAAITALLADLTPSFKMVEAFKERKEYFIPALKAIPGVKVSEPHGAFYAFPDVSSYFGKSNGTHQIDNADDMALYLMNVAQVTGVSGAAFGEDHCIRFSFAASMDQLKEAIDRVKKGLADLK